jgi:oxygen-independent coproporphyrinogen-3 oxidase
MPPFGVYVHVPFCTTRCGYCGFATWTDRAHLVEAYVDACVTDVERQVARGAIGPVTSVYFGGGTPSLLAAPALARILAAIPRVPSAEVSVECNPDSVDLAKLAAYREAGVTRLSFGVQSMVPRVLAALGRTHDPAGVARAVADARGAGFENFNLDLIYGAPGESLDDWKATLDAALALDPPHVSAYALSIERGSPLAASVDAGEVRATDDDAQADAYVWADEALHRAGLECYEVSNWARSGHECRHNRLYWFQGDYAAVGCSAHGHRRGRRWWNVATPERYVARVASGCSPEAGAEHLTDTQRFEEAFALGLRTREGAPVPPGARAEARLLAAAGFLTERSGRVALTPGGRLVCSDVTTRLLVAAGRGTPVGTR